MKTDTCKSMLFLLASFLAFAHCTDLKSAANRGDGENGENATAAVTAGDDELHRPETEPADPAAAGGAAAARSGRQYYQPFGYQPFPQRRAYRGPGQQMAKKKPPRTKQGRRPRPRRRPAQAAVGPPQSSQPVPMGRYRRLPPPLRTQQVNYIDAAADYDDGYESAPPMTASLDYGEFDHEFASYGRPVAGEIMSSGVGPMHLAPAGRSRKRPAAAAAAAMVGYVQADEPPQAVVHVPVRVQARPAAAAAVFPTPVTVVTTADPMEKLRRLVHEAMDEHFANRHQELYADGFDKSHHQGHPVYSAKYKLSSAAAAAADKEKEKDRRYKDAIKQETSSQQPAKKDAVGSAYSSADADADGSDDRLTLAEISAYMGAKPAETVLSAGGHRYVLSDALQQSYRLPAQQQQQQQQQQQHYHHQHLYDAGDDHRQQYLRYVSPFEALYELPVGARWTYK